jgi:hypothetical protein
VSALRQELLPPYLDALIGKLLRLLQNGAKLVQEGALTALASVADCAKEAFVKYYDQVAPPFPHFSARELADLLQPVVIPIVYSMQVPQQPSGACLAASAFASTRAHGGGLQCCQASAL